MELSFIETLTQQLNYSWFLKKKNCFQREGLYSSWEDAILPEPSPIDYAELPEASSSDYAKPLLIRSVAAVTFFEYCWSSDFPGSDAYTVSGIPDQSHGFPKDGKTICNEIITALDEKMRDFTSPNAINILVQKAVNTIYSELIKLKAEKINHTYHQVLQILGIEFERKMLQRYSHIRKQIEILMQKQEPEITVALCSRIADCRLPLGRFVTSVEGKYDRGEALYLLLMGRFEELMNTTIIVHDWRKQDVYYLLYKLSRIVTPAISVASLQKSESLLLHEDYFKGSSYYKWKSERLGRYRLQENAELIDTFLIKLF